MNEFSPMHRHLTLLSIAEIFIFSSYPKPQPFFFLRGFSLVKCEITVYIQLPDIQILWH